MNPNPIFLPAPVRQVILPGMHFSFKRSWLVLLLLGFAPLMGSDRLGDIEFFGYKDLDIEKIRKALPVRPGAEYSDGVKNAVRQAIVGALRKEPTDVAAVCCDERGNRLLFIGLPGASNQGFSYNPEPKGKERLPSDIMDLYARLDHAIEAAVRKGGPAAEEDDSQGYSLIKEPRARALQLAVRQWAIKHEPELLRILEFSSSVDHRRVASDALGYARQSHEQILALVRAARDPDDDVRNNATRALGVLVRSNAALGADISPDTFIEMLNSGAWTDRNKGAALLVQLTVGKASNLLTKIRLMALDSLLEMAAWKRPSHAYFARMVLGRVAGIPEERLQKLAWDGPVDTIINAARSH